MTTVCVMDASGALGRALVHRLLLGGYAVHAAVNDLDEMKRYEMQSRDDGRLRVFQSDPLDYHTITDALRGCSALFYSFAPPADCSTYDELMSELEIRAAHNVLEACAQTDTIDKVIFTSSATAVVWENNRNHHGGQAENVLDERNWSDVNFCRKYKLWHGVSKTMAEKTAWALAMDRGVNMVSINTGLLLSQDLNIKDPYLLGAKEMFKDGVFVTVDLQFLVDAHMCVFEDPSSYGRYLCFNHIVNTSSDILKLATMLLPSSASSPDMMEGDDGTHRQRISNAKLYKLMMNFETNGRTTAVM